MPFFPNKLLKEQRAYFKYLKMNSYPLLDKGTHIIIDIYEIENNDVLKYEESVIKILDDIAYKFKLNVLHKASHQFEPYGVTAFYILAESHLSIHTFVDERKAAMDLYTCTSMNNTDEVVSYVQSLFGACKICSKVVER
jgi:S-adenosylmethionine decarboxylase